jgi:hypothetical protein
VRRSGRLAAVTLLSLLLLPFPAAVRAADPATTEITSFTASGPGSTELTPGSPATLKAIVSGIPAGSEIVFEQLVAMGSIELGRGTVQMSDFLINGSSVFWAEVTVDPLGEGQRLLQARFDGTAELAASSRTLMIDLARTGALIKLTGPTQVDLGKPLALQLSATQAEGPAPTGTLELREGSTVLATGPAPTFNASLSNLPLGTHELSAHYSGDGNYRPGHSRSLYVTVRQNQLEAAGIGTSTTNIYPVVDGYRDTVAIRGNRLEPISLVARVFSPSGSLVSSQSVARGTGSYSLTWNGRTASGALLPAGHYRVDQALTDSEGLRRVFSTTVYLSWRKLVDRTVYLNQKGYDAVAEGSLGTGSVAYSNSSQWARLIAGSDGWAGVGYEFVLPEAIAYRSIQFQVQSKGPRSVPPNVIGMQNFTLCARGDNDWDETCFDKWAGIGNSTQSLAWFISSGAPSANRSGRYVRGMVSQNFGTTYVYNVRVRVVYAVLQ